MTEDEEPKTTPPAQADRLGYTEGGEGPNPYPKRPPARTADPNRMLRLDEVADRLSVSPATVRRLVKDGELHAVRVGKVWRVRPQDLEAYIKGALR